MTNTATKDGEAVWGVGIASAQLTEPALSDKSREAHQ
jgi:hypothetical protein